MITTTFQEGSFRDKVALVSGGTSGIGAVIFLCSSAAAFITGTILAVDGRCMAR